MKKYIFTLLFLLLPYVALAQNINIRDEGVQKGKAREINCIGAGIECLVSGGIASFTFGTFANGTGLSFNTIFGPITVKGGDSGNDDPALIFDDPTDGYLVLRFPNFMQINCDSDCGVLGNFYVEAGTFTTNLTVDNARSDNNVEINKFNITFTATDLTTSDAMSNMVVRSTYGTGGVASKGTLQNFNTSLVVQGAGDAANEYTPLISVIRADLGTGYTQSTGPTGRFWGSDLNTIGPVGVQPNLLNGITQLMLNTYNGSPADTPSGGIWIVTRPGTAGGIDATHSAATSYPIDVGLGCVGYSGASATTTPSANGFDTCIQIGGHGSGWLPNTENSRIGTGINISQYVTRAIYIHDELGTPTAAIEATAGAIIFGDLKTTGSASSKKVVCVDTSTGRLYASSTGVDCSN